MVPGAASLSSSSACFNPNPPSSPSMKMQARPVEALGRFTTIYKNALGVALGTHGTAFDHEPRERFAGLSFFIYRDEHREVLVCVGDKLFHKVSLEVYAKPRCSAFIASLSDAIPRLDLDHHHQVVQPIPAPASQPRDPPIPKARPQLDWCAKAKELGLQLHH